MAKSDVMIDPQTFQLAEHVKREYVAYVPPTTELKDVLSQDFWAHVAAQLGAFDRIEVRAEDGSWMAELVVIFAARNYAKVHLLNEYKLAAANDNEPVSRLHDIKWRGPLHKFAVIRKSDSEVIQEDFADKVAAQNWLLEHEKALT